MFEVVQHLPLMRLKSIFALRFAHVKHIFRSSYSSETRPSLERKNTSSHDSTHKLHKPFQNNNGNFISGITFVSNKERLYSARKVYCGDVGGHSGSYYPFTEMVKREKLKEIFRANQRFIKPTIKRGMEALEKRDRMCSEYVGSKVSKILSIHACIKE